MQRVPTKKLLYVPILVLISFNLFSTLVYAQLQVNPFSGNSADSYQCFDQNGKLIETSPNSGQPLTPKFDSATGEFYCDQDSNGKSIDRVRAVLRPPALQQVEIWFVRILYAVWALIASFSFLLLVYLGYRWVLSRGDVTQIQNIRKRIINYIIGFALVFLAVPILTTVFNLLGINRNVDCYNVNMPAFQFFFASLCTDPKNVVVGNPCVYGNLGDGYACSNNGTISGICDTNLIINGNHVQSYYQCIEGRWTIEYK